MKTKKILSPLILGLLLGGIALITAFTSNSNNEGNCPAISSQRAVKDYGGKTGACGSLGEVGTCSEPGCHGAGGTPAGMADNTSSGNMVVTSSPVFTANQYVPGQLYTITVTISQKGKHRFGFSCEMLDNSGNTNVKTNNTAGTLICSDPSTSVLKHYFGTGRECIAQDSFGGFAGNTFSFNFQWTAPSTGYVYDSVHLYVAGDATNNNDLADSGDYVFAQHIILTKSLTSLVTLQEGITDLTTYPNPATDRLTLTFYSPGDNSLQANLYSLDGKCVKELEDKRIQAGTFSRSYPVNDLAKGIYLLRINAGSYAETRKIIID